MDAVDRLQGPERQALLVHVGRLKHDLGKYIAFQIRWLDPAATAEQRRSALISDVLSTRRSRDRTDDAATVWREFRSGLTGQTPLDGGVFVDCSKDPWFIELDEAMARLETGMPALSSGRAGDDEVEQGIREALAVAEGCRGVHNRLMRG